MVVVNFFYGLEVDDSLELPLITVCSKGRSELGKNVVRTHSLAVYGSTQAIKVTTLQFTHECESSFYLSFVVNTVNKHFNAIVVDSDVESKRFTQTEDGSWKTMA